MPTEPTQKRTVVFVDGQNLYHSAKESFGHQIPNYDILALSKLICSQQNWIFDGARFYTGVPEHKDKPVYSDFWSRKLLSMKRQGIVTFDKKLKRRVRGFQCQHGDMNDFIDYDEKGIDVRIALDMVALTHAQKFDVALVFSQDQDLAEACKEVQAIARTQNRWLKVASAYPYSGKSKNTYGIHSTTQITIAESDYNQCLDKYDFMTQVLKSRRSVPAY